MYMKYGKWKIIFSLFLAMVLTFGMADTVLYATEAGSGEEIIEVIPTSVSNLTATYDAEKERIILMYTMSPETKFVRIYVNGAVDETEYTGTTYYFEDAKEGETYLFRVEPYDINGNAGTSAETTMTIEFQPAIIKKLEANYDSEEKLLEVDWEGTGIEYVNIWLDTTQIGTNVKGDAFVYTTDLLQKQNYVITLQPYNSNNELGEEKKYEFNTGVFGAYLADSNILYNEELRQLEMSWVPVNTSHVEISLNDETLAEFYTGFSFVYPVELQPGAKYVVSVLPFNSANEAGEEVEDDVSFGYFDVPYIDVAKLTATEVIDSTGNQTGFCKPAVSLTWEAQKKGIYEIYRATQDKKTAYTWLTTVTADVNGNYTYVDETVEVGTYYYKIRRKIKEDDFTDPMMFSDLSDGNKVKVSLAKPVVTAEIGDNGAITLNISNDNEFITGYDIYRSSGGSFSKIASIAENTYTDESVAFGSSYKYKVKSYYYSRKTKTTSYSSYSAPAKVKNMVGEISAKVAQTAANKVKVSWDAVPNAQGYEVYYRSSAMGDSYALLGITTGLEYVKTVGKNGTYYFMVKAYHTTADDKTYFSSSEVVCKTGFVGPSGVNVKKTSYLWNKETNALTQKSLLAWNRVFGAAGYYVERFDQATQQYVTVATIKKAKKTSCWISNVVINGQQPMIYRVSAYNRGKTRIKEGETVTITPALGQVTGVKVSKSKGKINIKWKAVMGAEGYRVYRSNGRHAILVADTNGLAATDLGLVTGVDYSYYVEAYSKSLGLTGERSEPKLCTGSISKVKGFKAKTNAKGNVVLNWKVKDGAKTYYIYYGTEKNGNYQLLGSTSKLTYTHKISGKKGVSGGKIYYRIVASIVNIVGAESESKPATTQISI